MIQSCVAGLGKGTTIPCGLRLVLNHLGGSVCINSIVLEY